MTPLSSLATVPNMLEEDLIAEVFDGDGGEEENMSVRCLFIINVVVERRLGADLGEVGSEM